MEGADVLTHLIKVIPTLRAGDKVLLDHQEFCVTRIHDILQTIRKHISPTVYVTLTIHSGSSLSKIPEQIELEIKETK